MKIPFACPACGANGTVDDSLVGRSVRCKGCQHRFPIARPDEAEAAFEAGYLLDQPDRGASASPPPASGPVYVRSRGDEPTVSLSPRKPKASRTRRRSTDTRPDFPWGAWLIGLGSLAAIALVLVATLMPKGLLIAGSTLVTVGMLMVLVGFFAGAYGAFSEDFLYGFFYLVFPLYTAYYLVTRWEDLWRWTVCSTTGVGLVLMGTEVLRWGGVSE